MENFPRDNRGVRDPTTHGDARGHTRHDRTTLHTRGTSGELGVLRGDLATVGPRRTRRAAATGAGTVRGTTEVHHVFSSR
jgi:hypothetical protein